MSEPGLPSAMNVQLASFDGPLDLLLHLIRSNQMDIFDIPVVEIARQYERMIELMHELNLEVAGEFLLMAATLAHIKSRMMLPPDPLAEGEEAEDPRAELTRQLVDYQKYRAAAETLQAMDSVRSLVWVRPPREFPDYDGESELVVDLFALMGAFRKLLDLAAAQERLRLGPRSWSVEEKIRWLSDRLASERSLAFVDLLGSMSDRGEMIATFLALLELIRLRAVIARQKLPLGEIWISVGEPAAPAALPGGES